MLSLSQNLSKEIVHLDSEVARLTEDGNKLVQRENIGGDVEEKLNNDIHDIEERYNQLKINSNDNVKRSLF